MDKKQARILKVPSSIKEKMHKLASLTQKVAKLDREISEYFESKGLDEDALRCGNGVSLDELNYGEDVTDEFCKWIESGGFDDASSPFRKGVRK